MMQYRNWIIGLVAAFQACGMPSEEETLTTEAFELRVPRVRWGPCQPAAEGVECAVVKVPLDYDQPRGAQIDIALSRFPAADQRRKKGSVFVNPGGPGGSGEAWYAMGSVSFSAKRWIANSTLLGLTLEESVARHQ
jgi:hypothetical protein